MFQPGNFCPARRVIGKFCRALGRYDRMALRQAQRAAAR